KSTAPSRFINDSRCRCGSVALSGLPVIPTVPICKPLAIHSATDSPKPKTNRIVEIYPLPLDQQH
ncbi:MAG: hypothetical protein KAR38_12320, partial [Calditrichia bacterium]|nr:hypothetical protein [Calditrichia bacterium]